MGRRTGGIAIQGKTGVVRDNDVSFTLPVAQVVVDYLQPHYKKIYSPTILDACANDGVLGYSIYNNCEYSQLELQDIKVTGQKVQDTDFGGRVWDIIICNPPWTPVEEPLEIYNKLVSLLEKGGVLFFVINNVFCYQGWKRAVELKFQKYYFLPRYVFKASGKPLLDCGIMVYHNGRMPMKAARLRPFIHIPPEAVKNEILDRKKDNEANIFNGYHV